MSKTVSLTRQRPEVSRRVFLSEEHNTDHLKSRERGSTPTPYVVGVGRGTLSQNGTDNKNKTDSTVPSSHIVESVEQAALGMTKADRQALLDRLSLSLQETDTPRDSGMWVLGVVRALESILGAGGASAYGPAVAKGIVGGTKGFAPVAEFIKTVGLDEFHIVERQAALNFLAEMVVADADDFARHAGIPLGLKLVAQRSVNVRGIFDRAFPSYLSAGLGKIVFRQMSTRSSWDGDRSCAS